MGPRIGLAPVDGTGERGSVFGLDPIGYSAKLNTRRTW
jgi:hypothetical protein